MEENTNSPTPEAKKPSAALWAVIGVVVLVVVGFVLARTMGNEESDTAMMDADMPAMMSQGEVKTVAVEGGSFYYKPNEIRVKKGDKVRVVLESKDMMHDFVIDELGVRTAILKAGETGTVEFTADKTGTFEYYCSVGQHRANGMVGKLIVE